MKRMNLRGISIPAILLSFSILVWNQPTLWAQQPAKMQQAKNFEWSAQLVTMDRADHTVTVKVRVPYEEAFPEFEHLKAGDRVVLTWSGVRAYSDGIRSVTPYDAADKPLDHFMFPAEFVSFNSSQHVVTIKVPIPAKDVPMIQSVKPGAWVTATSPHGQDANMEPISAIRPYRAPSGS